MASYSRFFLRMLPMRRWPLPSLGPVWLSEPQPACRVLWPSGQSLLERVATDMEQQVQELDRMSRAFFQASPLWAWEREDRRVARPDGVPRTAEKEQHRPPAATYQFSVDVAGFAPEELTVKLDGRKVTVSAERQRESESEEGGHWQEHQELRRETLLPLDADLQGVSCSLASDGRLCIQAPRLTEKEIPIDIQPAAPDTQDGEKEVKPKEP